MIKILVRVVLSLILLLVLVISVIVVTNLVKTPLMDRNWEEQSKRLSNVEISSDQIEIKNIRDWRYQNQEVISKNYYDETFDVSKIVNTYLVFNPFGQWQGVGHSFFVFEFEDGKSVSISIEARKEEGEEYTVLKGLLNKFELWYGIGSSADFMTQRAIFWQEDLRIYPLLIPKEISKALFVDIVTSAQKLETEPAFYNTVTSNCTNLLIDAANRVRPGSIPFHYSRLFTGYIDNQLYDLGYIPHNDPFDVEYAQAKIDDFIRDRFMTDEEYTNDEFWSAIKTEKFK